MNDFNNPPVTHRAFKMVFVPLLIFSLLSQLALVRTQLTDIQNGYFDFVLYYSAAKMVNDGNGARLYDLEWQRKYQERVRPVYLDRDLPFNHPPYELLVLLIPAKLSFPIAHLLWALVNIALLAVILARMFSCIEPQHHILVTLILLAFFPTITTLKMGQDSIITTLLLVETFVSLKHKRFARAGVVLALGLYKPQFVLPLAGILVVDRRWRSVCAFLITGLFLGVISFALVGGAGLKQLFLLWLPMVHRGNFVWPELMTNLRGLIYIILGLVGLRWATNFLTLAFSVLIYILTVWLWRRNVERGNDFFDLAFALAVVTTVLVSFHLYSYDATLLAIPLIVLLNQILKIPGRYSLRHRIFLGILIVLFLPLLPNVLLSKAMLAWWAFPLPILFGIIVVSMRGEPVKPDISGAVVLSAP